MRVPCRECGRPVPDESYCGCCCLNHDNPPPRPRPGIPRPEPGVATALALAWVAIPLGTLVAHLRADYAVIPTPDGPAVIHVQEDTP